MKYDRDKAIQQATELFWEQGYQATKMRDLQQHLDMRPGSIYAGFGNKENLFKEVLAYYVAGCLEKMGACLEKTPDALTGLRQFFESELLATDAKAKSKLCLLVKTLSELDGVSEELAAQAKQGMTTIETKFAEILNLAKQQDAIDPQADCSQFAKWLQMQMIGLRVFAKSHDQVEVQKMLDQIFAHLTQVKKH